MLIGIRIKNIMHNLRLIFMCSAKYGSYHLCMKVTVTHINK